MCERASKELENGFYVNLGIGMPTLVANYISEKNNITLQSENGMLGMGPFPKKGEEDPDLINAGKQTITSLPDSSFFSSADSFSMIRGGHIDLSIVKAWKGDKSGNLIYRKTARNFNPVMATAGKVTIAEVEELCEIGELDPDHIHTPGIYVNRILEGRNYTKAIENLTLSEG